METVSTTVAVQQYLNALATTGGDSPAEPVVRELLAQAANRLHLLCAGMLYRRYPRLTRGPVNLRSEEMLSAVVERLIRALREVHPTTVRQFFGLANQHIRWELNDVARRLDEAEDQLELSDAVAHQPALAEGRSKPSLTTSRILDAIEKLPEEEREVFNLVRIQGLTQLEAADVVRCSERTLQRRLSRALVLLSEQLQDLRPPRWNGPT
jgi:RNA polymerase sigma factor (sigma-70 family)